MINPAHIRLKQVVQHGRRVAVNIVKTPNKGWGKLYIGTVGYIVCSFMLVFQKVSSLPSTFRHVHLWGYTQENTSPTPKEHGVARKLVFP